MGKIRAKVQFFLELREKSDKKAVDFDLLPIQFGNTLAQIPLWRRRWRLTDLVAALDEDVFRESANVVCFQEEDVVAEVKERPVLPLFCKLLLYDIHLVVWSDSKNLYGVLPLVVQAPQLRELPLTDGRYTIDELQEHQALLII